MDICEKTKEASSKDTFCSYNNFKKARYFHGMLLTDRDFREEQLYHNEKRRLINRMLHGWGVVCGLGIKSTDPESSKVIITRGMALDCCGNEIVVCEDFEIDLKKEAELCPGIAKKDPCAEEEKEGECKYYVAIKYIEAPTDPVPVYTPSGGCEEKTCDYSRTREGFCIKLFKTPPCHTVLPEDGLVKDVTECLKGNKKLDEKLACLNRELGDFHESFCGQPYPCPICCCEGGPYVVLGTIDFAKTRCKVTTVSNDMIDINDARRYVLTWMFWQYYLGSFFNPITAFLDNPFVNICRFLGAALKQISKIDTPEVSGRVGAIRKMATVNEMSVDQAKAELKKQNLVYADTVTLTPDRLMDIAGRAIAVEKIEPKRKVDLVIDKKGKVLFYVPAAEMRKEDVSVRLTEAEKTISSLQKRIAEMEKLIKQKK